ncbi:MAG: ATP-binding protein [Desulfurellaceae bacterium]|nr:ATP-binding protein [Desulfurellaceae bacterium]
MSDRDFSQIQALVDRPTESLSIELKRWIDPDQPEGAAKIVKTALALRNHGGGYLVIGFDDHTHEPDQENVPQDVKVAFHIDKIQALISKYASEPFEVSVEFPEREGQPYPVISIPPGVKTPVAVKADLRSARALIGMHDVYLRSLSSNNTPSTTKATWKDWPGILEVCFDNREADIGRFLRRHIGGLPPEVVQEFLGSITSGLQPEVTIKDRLQRYLQESRERYSTVVEKQGAQLPSHGAWEVGLLFIGDDIPLHSADQDFLNLLNSSNPRCTGWPIWVDSRNFASENAKPYPFEDAWEASIDIRIPHWLNHIDFMRLDPTGQFYLRRVFDEDIREQNLEPIEYLDFTPPIRGVAEAIAVGLAFAKAMGCGPEKTQLVFGFRWTKLQGRRLASLVEPARYIPPQGPARQDEVFVFVEVPLETPLSALGEFVNRAVEPLFRVFNGFVLGKDVVEDLTRQTIQVR